MSIQNAKISFLLYAMSLITLVLVAGVIMYLSHSTTTEETMRADKNIIPLTGPWKFITGDDKQYALSNYDDSEWETVDLPRRLEHMTTTGPLVCSAGRPGHPNYSLCVVPPDSSTGWHNRKRLALGPLLLMIPINYLLTGHF